MSDAPRFSIVIPTHQREQELGACLQRILGGKQVGSHGALEVIVSDDARSLSLPATLPTEVRYLPGPGKGPAANRNNGARGALGEWLIFLDDDCLPDPGWLAGFEGAIEKNPKISVFEGRIYVASDRKSFWEVSPTNENGGYLWSCNFAIRRSLFHSLGGFDERFPFATMEDVDLRYRIKQRGEEFVFVPEASVEHPWRVRRRAGFAEQRESTLLYLSLHPEERAHLNTRYFLYAATYGFVRHTLPALFRGAWRGIDALLLEQLSQIRLALRLLFFKP